MKMKQVLKKYAVNVSETELLKVYEVAYGLKRYKIYMLKKLTNKQTVIYCLENSLYYEQRPLFWHLAGKRYGDKVFFFKADKEKEFETIVVIRGNPDGIVGIDNGVFASYLNYNSNKINIMLKKHFYNLEV